MKQKDMTTEEAEEYADAMVEIDEETKPIKTQIEEDNHNWIDEKDCFNSGFDKGIQSQKAKEKEFIIKLKEIMINADATELETKWRNKQIAKLSKEVLGE